MVSLCCGVRPAAAGIPAGFVLDNVVPDANWDLPVCVRFLPDGRMLVVEKHGVVWVVADGVRSPTPLWSAEDEILNVDDRGLLSVQVDPDFATNRYVYFLYTVDPDSNGVDDNDDAFGRLTRYTVQPGEPLQVDPASRTILMGVDWRHGPLSASGSHTIGDMQWGADGSLLVSMGDGAQFNSMDQGGQDPNAFGPGKTDPYEDVGAFRAQTIRSLCGSILRLNPANGHGYASNPYANTDLTSPQSRVFAYGLRNPFRFRVRPGTGVADTSMGNPGVLYIGDVGWNDTEEMNVLTVPGMNFGWPCYEGPGQENEYQAATPAHSSCADIGTDADHPAPVSPPFVWWNHNNGNLSFPTGVIGNTSIGGAFYQGNLYPSTYVGRYFYADFGQSWMRTLEVDGANQYVTSDPFGDALAGPVQIVTDPTNGDILYVSIITQRVLRLRYAAAANGNTPPVAVGSANPDAGARPLLVQFTGDTSYDPDGAVVAYQWTFGDGTGSTQPNPSHTYTLPGLWTAILTVRDAAGAMSLDTLQVVVAESTVFPTTPVLDDFNRPDGPVGAPWIFAAGNLSIVSNQAAPTSPGFGVVWGGQSFGPNQEAYVTIGPLATGAPEHDLNLKVQGTGEAVAEIEVRYDDVQHWVAVGTYDPAIGWQGNFVVPVQLVAGDRLGARAYGNGTVQVYVNDALIGATDISFWQYHDQGGYIGMTLVGAQTSRLDDFGGGDVVFDTNQPPTATILSPADTSFFAAGDTVQLHGTAVDPEDPVGALAYRFDVDLHHNTHVHPSTHVVFDSTGSFVAENHDDGTGVWFEIRFSATDTGGMADTARVSIFPEIDLTPGGFGFDRAQLGDADTSTVTFRLHNLGAMPAPIFHWTLAADGAQVLAEGDTLIAARDSVTITRTLPPSLGAGMHVLRVTADTLGAVVETCEANNAFTGTIEVVPGNGTSAVGDATVRELALGNAWPNPSAGTVGFALALPRGGDVSFAVLDVQGRQVWRARPSRFEPGRWTLSWNGRARGAPAPPGIYLARVVVEGRVFTKRFALLR